MADIEKEGMTEPAVQAEETDTQEGGDEIEIIDDSKESEDGNPDGQGNDQQPDEDEIEETSEVKTEKPKKVPPIENLMGENKRLREELEKLKAGHTPTLNEHHKQESPKPGQEPEFIAEGRKKTTERYMRLFGVDDAEAKEMYDESVKLAVGIAREIVGIQTKQFSPLIHREHLDGAVKSMSSNPEYKLVMSKYADEFKKEMQTMAPEYWNNKEIQETMAQRVAWRHRNDLYGQTSARKVVADDQTASARGTRPSSSKVGVSRSELRKFAESRGTIPETDSDWQQLARAYLAVRKRDELLKKQQ